MRLGGSSGISTRSRVCCERVTEAGVATTGAAVADAVVATAGAALPRAAAKKARWAAMASALRAGAAGAAGTVDGKGVIGGIAGGLMVNQV